MTNITIEYVLSEWTKDAPIDEFHLDKASTGTALLHSKYLQMYSISKLALKRAEMKMDRTKKNKKLWFDGKLSKDEIDKLGWVDDPFDGLSVLKSEYEYWYSADKDLQKLVDDIEILKITRDALKDIMDTIKYRSHTIKNVIDWRKFMEGS